jgi:hypothetical protein
MIILGQVCDYCKNKLEDKHYAEVLERKKGIMTGKRFYFCFPCYKKFFSWEVDGLDLHKDDKYYLDKWKQQSLTIQ